MLVSYYLFLYFISDKFAFNKSISSFNSLIDSINNGTSFSSPIVAGVAGMILSRFKNVNGFNVHSLFDPYGEKGWCLLTDYYLRSGFNNYYTTRNDCLMMPDSKGSFWIPGGILESSADHIYHICHPFGQEYNPLQCTINKDYDYLTNFENYWDGLLHMIDPTNELPDGYFTNWNRGSLGKGKVNALSAMSRACEWANNDWDASINNLEYQEEQIKETFYFSYYDEDEDDTAITILKAKNLYNSLTKAKYIKSPDSNNVVHQNLSGNAGDGCAILKGCLDPVAIPCNRYLGGDGLEYCHYDSPYGCFCGDVDTDPNSDTYGQGIPLETSTIIYHRQNECAYPRNNLCQWCIDWCAYACCCYCFIKVNNYPRVII